MVKTPKVVKLEPKPRQGDDSYAGNWASRGFEFQVSWWTVEYIKSFNRKIGIALLKEKEGWYWNEVVYLPNINLPDPLVFMLFNHPPTGPFVNSFTAYEDALAIRRIKI